MGGAVNRKKKKTFLPTFLSRQNLTYRVSGVHANIRHKGDAVNRKKKKKKIHFPLAMGGKRAIMTHAHDGRTGNHNLPNI
jgi:hypothetical protein